ncbi:uncharacterized protein PHACADRAFT_213181 [Phanerochaete carnosa HHB-10118-sp]|uniref:Protein kinase domain-containing protein n=1 Tax=Phanerochaete carnosa (strain HHB-10118-sp) TaxID=650164 RepID=K5VXM6_PHACS|nr:uncharacterized protein PHACADRAFT_213181 [Phanerochaete carnosa HHB-10118-sp]EKM51339.1 hypothetical protein PHACADRAFT_213181 [Phanerochaete carnosa HHB-10118-sp]
MKGAVHTDVHPHNILIQPKESAETAIVEAFLKGLDPAADNVGPVPFPKVETKERLFVALTDLESAHLITNSDKHHFMIQPHHLRALEVILGAQWGPAADIWSLGCLIYEWATGGLLFKYDAAKGDPQEILGQMVRILGDLPPDLVAKGRLAKSWFSTDGALKSSPKDIGLSLEAMTVFNLLETTDYEPPLPDDFDDHELASFIHFICQMICLDPQERWSGMDLVGHPWLHSALGWIIEVMERKEAERSAERVINAPSSD